MSICKSIFLKSCVIDKYLNKNYVSKYFQFSYVTLKYIVICIVPASIQRKMRVVLPIWLLLMASFELSVQQCTIEEFTFEIENRLSATMITINSTYYNCLSRSDTSDHYSSMSVSILYIRSDDPNSIHEVRYNLQCNNSVWEIVGNQSTALRKNNTVFCEDCTDQTVNDYHCTDYLSMDKVEY